MENFREEEAKEEEQLPEFYPSDSIKENSYHMIYGKPPSDHYRFAKTSANIKWPSDLWKSGKLIYDIVHQEKCAPPPETPEDTILRFDSKFESGNLSKVYHIKGNIYHCILEYDRNSSASCQWFYFKITNTRPQKYMFYISGFHKAKSLYCNGSKIFWYSKKRAQIKNVSWTRGGTNYAYSVTKRSKKNPRASLQFQICFPYADDEVCLCYAIPYTYSDLLKSIDHWDNIAKPGVFKHETLCSTDGGRDCPILTITSPNNTIPLEKRKYIFITGRIHPGESNSSFLVHGLIDFLLSDTPEANYIIESTIIKCVPMMNIDGVVEGFYRVSLSGNDLNRMWTAPDLILHPVVYHTKSLIRKIVSEKGCTFYIDFHGHSRLHGTFIYGCPNDDDHEFRNSEKIYPGILSLLSDTFSLSHCVFSFPQERKSAGRIVVRTEFNILNSYTVETSFGGVFAGGCANCLYDETLWKEIGEKCGLAIYHYLLDDNSQYTKYAKKKVELLAPKTLPVSQNQEKEKIQIDMTNKSDCFGKRKFTEDDISSVSLGVKQPKWERISFKLEK